MKVTKKALIKPKFIFRLAVQQNQESIATDMIDDKLLDDVFFIVKQCVNRAAGCGNLDGLCAVANNACTILDTEFSSVLLSQLKLGFPSGRVNFTVEFQALVGKTN